MVGELPMRMAVIEEAERVIEPLLVWLARGTRLAQSPLSDQSSAVTGIMHDLCQRHVLESQWHIAAWHAAVPANPGVAGVQAGHQSGSRWGAHRTAGVILR